MWPGSDGCSTPSTTTWEHAQVSTFGNVPSDGASPGGHVQASPGKAWGWWEGQWLVLRGPTPLGHPRARPPDEMTQVHGCLPSPIPLVRTLVSEPSPLSHPPCAPPVGKEQVLLWKRVISSLGFCPQLKATLHGRVHSLPQDGQAHTEPWGGSLSL